MIARSLKYVIQKRLKDYPAVALLGPRQVGKTTLAKTFSDVYYDLELEQEKLRLDLQWENVVSGERLIILDEAQNFPEIFSRIRHCIDENRSQPGRFLILGSVSPGLMTNVAEFLTGRIAICELSPLSVSEMNKDLSDNLWLFGGYPDGGILQQDKFPVWQQNYLDLLAMRDLPLWGLPAKPQVTKRFFKMLAVLHGNTWNASQLGKSLGLNYHTVNSYRDFLEQTYLVRIVQPYFANTKKRLVKSPKIYWRDSGLLHSLNNIRDMQTLLEQPWVGFSWESWVIEQILIYLEISDIPYDGPYFFRTRDGQELDLVFEVSGSLWAIEVKLKTAPVKEDIDKLSKTADLINAERRVLISRTLKPISTDKVMSTNLENFFDALKSEI